MVTKTAGQKPESSQALILDSNSGSGPKRKGLPERSSCPLKGGDDL